MQERGNPQSERDTQAVEVGVRSSPRGGAGGARESRVLRGRNAPHGPGRGRRLCGEAYLRSPKEEEHCGHLSH